MLLVEAQCEVVGDLSAGGNDYAVGRFEVEDIHHALKGQLVEIEAVAHVVVGRNRLGVVVDHDGAVTLAANGAECLNAAPVKFYRRADSVGTRTEHHDALLIVFKLNVVRRAAICEIEVIGLCGIFCGERVDLLHAGHDAELLAEVAHRHDGLFHALRFFQSHGAGNLEVGEALALGAAQEVLAQRGKIGAGVQFAVGEMNVVELLQEPLVNLREFVDLVDGVALQQSLFDNEDALVGRLA